MKGISVKTKYVRTDGWRGYVQPINAVAGANDTGGWEDSPCPTAVCQKELEGFRAILKENKIKSVYKACESSNVFCQHIYLLVAPADREKALELAKEYRDRLGIRLFYACD